MDHDDVNKKKTVNFTLDDHEMKSEDETRLDSIFTFIKSLFALLSS